MTVTHLINVLGTRTLRQFSMICGVALFLSSAASTAHASPVPVPEISADAMGSALTLLSGGVLLLTRRYSR
jgi:hypothetical protein